jgi:aminoglycoside phosphotransferase
MTEATDGPVPRQFGRRPLSSLLATPGTRTVTVAGSVSTDAKVNMLLIPPGRQAPELAVKIPTTQHASEAVEREARVLVDLRRMELGMLRTTIPRFVQVCDHEGRSVLVASAVPGVPLARAYGNWSHTARPTAVAEDFAAAGDWLARFQDATSSAAAPVDLLAGAAERIRRLPDRVPSANPRMTAEVADRIDLVHDLLGTQSAPRTAVHGDFWFGNLLVDHPGTGRVTGVVDWENACTRGEPLKDLGRFAISYSMHLDRNTAPGRRVTGHWRLRADHDGAAVAYGLTGSGWYPRLVRSFLMAGLARLGLPEALWYAVGWAGLADAAATDGDAGQAWRQVRTLSRLPHPTVVPAQSGPLTTTP